MNHPAAVVALLGLLAAWPFVVRPSLPPHTHDLTSHVYRVSEVAYSLRAGDLYPRWAPNSYYGYGYPGYNYYPPLPYLAANLFSLATPQSAVFGVRMLITSCFLCGAFGMFGLVRRCGSALAGILAAGSFVFAPYVFSTELHIRGALPEFVAVTISPLFLWALHRFADEGDRRHFALAAFFGALTIAAHTLTGAVFFLLGFASLIWRTMLESIQDPPKSWHRSMVGFVPLLAGVGLAAFFWLPFVFERHEVQLFRGIPNEDYEYEHHFVGFPELFEASVPLDLAAVNPPIPHSLGPTQWILAAVGVVTLLSLVSGRAGRQDQRSVSRAVTQQLRESLFWALSLAGCCFLMSSLSQPLWDAVPGMRFLQFPWRLLGPAAICLAALAGTAAYIVVWLPLRLRRWVAGFLIVTPLFGILPIFVPASWEEFPPTDRVAMLATELTTPSEEWWTAVASASFLPKTVRVPPRPNAAMVASVRRDGIIDRLGNDLPQGASLETVAQGPLTEEYVTVSAQDFDLRVRRFMFAGWRAEVDGRRVNIEASEPEGFIVLPVPAGTHGVTLRFGTTTPRIIAWTVTGLSLLALFIVGCAFPRTAGSSRTPAMALGTPVAFFLALFFVTLAAGSRLGLVQPSHASRELRPARQSLPRSLEGGVDFLGYDLHEGPVRTGDTLKLTLYWTAREAVAADFAVFVHLVDASDHILSQSDRMHPGNLSTSGWKSGRYVRDAHELQIPMGAAPGDYTLRLGLYLSSTMERKRVIDENGTVLEDAIRLPARVSLRH